MMMLCQWRLATSPSAAGELNVAVPVDGDFSAGGGETVGEEDIETPFEDMDAVIVVEVVINPMQATKTEWSSTALAKTNVPHALVKAIGRTSAQQRRRRMSV